MNIGMLYVVYCNYIYANVFMKVLYRMYNYTVYTYYVYVYVAGSKRAIEDGKEGPKVDVQLVMATATLTKAVRALLDDVSAVRVDGGVKVCDLFPLFIYRQ